MSDEKMEGFFPNQRKTYKQKIKNDYDWVKNMISHIEVQGNQNDYSYNYKSETDYDRKLSNYKLYNNEIDQSYFDKTFNPMGIDAGQYKDEIQPYNQTYTKIDVLLGEELKRPFNYKAVLVNSEGTRKKNREKTRLLRKYIQQEVQKERQKMNVQLNPELSKEEKQQRIKEIQEEFKDIMPPEDIEKYMQTDYRAAEEILVSRILQYLEKKQSLKEKKNDGFKHGLISGEELTWVGISGGEPVVENLNPLSVFYHKSPETKYIQNGMYAGSVVMMTRSEILDRFGDDLSKKDYEKLSTQETAGGTHGIRPDLISKDMKTHNVSLDYQYNSGAGNTYARRQGSYGETMNNEEWEVLHVEWVSEKKIGFLSYIDPLTGQEEETIVSEEYEPAPDEEIEWDWIPEVWEGTRIGSDIYVNMQPKEYQFRSIENPYQVKLGYHGLIYNTMNTNPVSPMDRMKPFQYLYFIVMHKLKKLIAQDRGKVMPLDITMVDGEIGLEKTIHYLNEMDIDIYNPFENKDHPGYTPNRQKASHSIDRSNAQQIVNYIQILDSLDMKIGEAAGVSRAREGQTSPNEAVGVNQQSIMQSSHITEAIFFAHNKHWENVLNSLVEVTQVAWEDESVVRQYVLDDQSSQMLDTESADLQESEFGVFVSDSLKDHETFEQLKSLAQPLLQNDKAELSDIMKIFKHESTEALTREIEQAEKQKQKQEQQQFQQQMQQEQQKQQQEKEIKLKELKQQDLENIRDNKTDLEVAKIQSFTMQQDQDTNDNDVPDQLEIEKLEHDKEKNMEEQNLKQRELSLKERQQQAEEKSKEEELDIKKKEAKAKMIQAKEEKKDEDVDNQNNNKN